MKAVLTYHSVDDSGSVISIDRARFRAHVDWLAISGIRVVALDEIVGLPENEAAVAITFDDGFRNFLTDAWPVLRDHRMPVTVFVVTARLGTTNGWSARGYSQVPELPLMSWSDVETLAAEGVAIGSHTRTHSDLRTLNDAELEDDVGGAVSVIRERIAQKSVHFAYPYGAFDARSMRVVQQHHSIACTTELRFLRQQEEPIRLPRVDAYYLRRAGMLERFGSPSFRRYLGLRAGGRRLRQAVVSVVGHR